MGTDRFNTATFGGGCEKCVRFSSIQALTAPRDSGYTTRTSSRIGILRMSPVVEDRSKRKAL
jgi:hypothetical protein